MSGTVTPNFRLQKPPFDDIPWDDAVNGNMDIIDSALAQYLTIANFAGVWKNSTVYSASQVLIDAQDSSMWRALISHTSPPGPTIFAQARAAAPTQWTPASATVASSAQTTSTFKNKIINSMFYVQQRGLGPFNTLGAYTADRWLVIISGGTCSTTIAPLSDADRAAIGDEEAKFCIASSFAGGAGVDNVTAIVQPIEDVRTLAGKTVTVSFWAWAAAPVKLGVGFTQVFGTGGSPSSGTATTGTTVQLSTTRTRYSMQFTLPSVQGKVFGTNNDSYLQLNFFYSAQSAANWTNGPVGVQSGTVAIWGVQVEAGAIVSPLEKPPVGLVVAACQRFYQIVSCSARFPATATGQVVTNTVSWQWMRRIPTTTFLSASAGQFGASVQLDAKQENGGAFTLISSQAGDSFQDNSRYSLSAEF